MLQAAVRVVRSPGGRRTCSPQRMSYSYEVLLACPLPAAYCPYERLFLPHENLQTAARCRILWPYNADGGTGHDT